MKKYTNFSMAKITDSHFASTSTLMMPSNAQTEKRNKSLKILTWNIYMLPSIVPLPSRAKAG
jgi:spermidine/putrescine-binding protein